MNLEICKHHFPIEQIIDYESPKKWGAQKIRVFLIKKLNAGFRLTLARI